MDGRSRPAAAVAEIRVPEIRDYHAINLEIVRLLEGGNERVLLAGVRGQRLLVAGIAGPWRAVVELDGDAGPELAAGLDAPGLTVVCRGSAEDGGASGLRSGCIVVQGSAGTAFGYAQRGGLAVVAGPVGPRAGLLQVGGDLMLLGDAGPLAGERQAGGRVFALARLGGHPGHGRLDGQFIRVGPQASGTSDQDLAAWRAALEPVREWIPQQAFPGPVEGRQNP